MNYGLYGFGEDPSCPPGAAWDKVAGACMCVLKADYAIPASNQWGFECSATPHKEKKKKSPPTTPAKKTEDDGFVMTGNMAVGLGAAALGLAVLFYFSRISRKSGR